jgi:hypothetical protein
MIPVAEERYRPTWIPWSETHGDSAR